MHRVRRKKKQPLFLQISNRTSQEIKSVRSTASEARVLGYEERALENLVDISSLRLMASGAFHSQSH